MDSGNPPHTRAHSLAWLERPADNREVKSPNLFGPTTLSWLAAEYPAQDIRATSDPILLSSDRLILSPKSIRDIDLSFSGSYSIPDQVPADPTASSNSLHPLCNRRAPSIETAKDKPRKQSCRVPAMIHTPLNRTDKMAVSASILMMLEDCRV